MRFAGSSDDQFPALPCALSAEHRAVRERAGVAFSDAAGGLAVVGLAAATALARPALSGHPVSRWFWLVRVFEGREQASDRCGERGASFGAEGLGRIRCQHREIGVGVAVTP